MTKYGPTRSELIFRLIFSLAGLAFLIVAVSVKPISGIAWVEVVGIGGVFFGGTAIWSLWQLRKGKSDESKG